MRAPVAPPEESEDPVYRDAIERVNAFISRFGDAVSAELDPLDEGGYTEIRYGEIIVGVNVNCVHGVLLFVVRMGELPDPPNAALLHHLLELNFLETGPCAFAIDEQTQRLFLRALRPAEGLQYEEFEGLLQTVAQVAETMKRQLSER